MAFRLYVSTSLEILAEEFCRDVYLSGSTDPLKPVTAAVQTQGIAVWLKQYLAEYAPAAMNLEFPFLRSSIETHLKKYVEGAELLSRSNLTADTWKIFHYLTDHFGDRELEELNRYMEHDPDYRKRYQISAQIANAFDQYRTFRPDLIKKWLNGEFRQENWQAVIYRALFQDILTIDKCIDRFINSPADPKRKRGDHLSIFGISSMPPQFLNFFLALSEYQDVSLFYLSPSSDYWSDADAYRKHGTKKSWLEEDPAVNPLLRVLSGHGRAFYEELFKTNAWDLADEQYAEDPEDKTFLNQIQSDIRGNLNVTEHFAPDGSLLIENCHTPLREVEVLHDRLLYEIKENGRCPGDILVTAPNIEKYVPYIESVFGTGVLADHYSIADRSFTESGAILPVLLKILELAFSQYTQSEVFSILESESVQNRFHLTADNILQIRKWCNAAGVRWGIDSEHRKDVCSVDFKEYSWAYGIRRMLSGYAIRHNMDGQLDMDVLPMDFAEGAEAETFGSFLDFLEEIMVLKEELSGQKTPKEWFEMLKLFPDRFCLVDEPAANDERSELIRFFSKMAEESSEIGISVPLPVIQEVLQNIMLTSGNRNQFLRGKITFCSMIPMRTVPMPVIAILGLNADDFPRKDLAPGFNLIAKDLRPTDRSKNQEDRYLLLETILAAGEKLLIFYQGQSERDNSEKFPTPPLAELIRYLEQRSGQHGANREFIVNHSVQAYSDRYFSKEKLLFTYSESAYEAAAAAKKIAGPVLPKDLPLADLSEETLQLIPLPEHITLEELNSFFKSPTAFYLQNQMGCRFSKIYRNASGDSEPFLPDHLEASNLKKTIIDYAVGKFREKKSSADLNDLYRYLQKNGQLSVGKVGKETFSLLCSDLEQILAETFLQNYTAQEYRTIEVVCEDSPGRSVMISGNMFLSQDRTKSYIYIPGKMKQKCMPQIWLQHLLLSAALDEYTETIYTAEDKIGILAGTGKEDAQKKLLLLLSIRQVGAERLVPFINEISYKENEPAGYKAYLNDISKYLSRDYSASIFYKKTDLTEPFARKVWNAVYLVYNGIEIKDPETK